MIITIDGPAGTGKTTVARRIAELLGYQYFDTGAMYRAFTLLILKKKINIQDSAALETLLKEFRFEVKSHNQEKRYQVSGEDVTDEIRTEKVTSFVSEVSALPNVRKTLIGIQREFGKKQNAVFEGRDMGTVVFPKAEFKFYLTARPAVRANRRYLELQGKQSGASEESILESILARDQFDSTREISPLKQAEDAHLIDTSDLSIEQVVEQILTLIQPKL